MVCSCMRTIGMMMAVLQSKREDGRAVWGGSVRQSTLKSHVL